MREYEIVAKFLNGCAGEAHPQTWFEEAELDDPAQYVRMKHGRDFDRFSKEVTPDGRVIYRYSNGTVTYLYEFTEI